MAKRWSEVTASPAYQSLSHDEKVQAQSDYFNQVVVPNIPKEERQAALKAFLAEYPLPQRDPTADMSGPERFAAGAGKAVADLGRGAGQLLGLVDSQEVDKAKQLDSPLTQTSAGFWGNVAGNVASAVPASFIPGANSYVGASLIGSGLGALQPTGADDSRIKNTLIGGAAGLGGQFAGNMLGKAAKSAAGRVANIESDVSAKAAAQAAADTASARSAAGNAAQNAYRQLEHLRELGALRGLSAEEAKIAAELEKELASKAGEKLIPSVAQKNITAQAYREAIETESKRAAELAAEKLGKGEINRQIGARVKRYGPAVVGGIVGNMLFPGLGGAVGGAATGLTLRPAVRSMINLSKNQAVQHGLLSPIARNGLLNDPALPVAMGLLSPSVYFANE